MSKCMRAVAAAGLVLGLAGVAVAADDLESVERKIQSAWEKHKSLTARINLTSHWEMAGTVVDSKGDGTLEYFKKGDKVYSRMEMKSDTVQKMGEQENKTQMQMLVVVDGDFQYTLNDTNGQKMAFKSKIDPRLNGEPKALFTELRKESELKLLPEEKVNDRKAYVVEATPRDKAAPAGAGSRTVFYFDQDSGFVSKVVMFDPAGKPLTTMTYSDVKLNADLNPDRFVFKAPEGVEVVDQTKGQP